MCNKTKIMILTGCLLVVNSAFSSLIQTNFDNFHKTMQDSLAEVRAHFDQVMGSLEQDFKKNIDHITTNLRLEVLEEPDYLKIILNLPQNTNWDKQVNKIDLEAKGAFLEGNLQHDQYKIKLLITDGRVLRASYQTKISQEESDQNSKLYRQAASWSSQSTILPERVNQLENSQAQITDDNKLVLLLPKQVIRNQGWHKIKVK